MDSQYGNYKVQTFNHFIQNLFCNNCPLMFCGNLMNKVNLGNFSSVPKQYLLKTIILFESR